MSSALNWLFPKMRRIASIGFVKVKMSTEENPTINLNQAHKKNPTTTKPKKLKQTTTKNKVTVTDIQGHSSILLVIQICFLLTFLPL